MVDYFTRTHTRTNTNTHKQAACSFLRIISPWSVSAWLGKAYFLPSVYSLQDHTKQTHSVGHAFSQHMHKPSQVIGVLFSSQPVLCLPTCQGVFSQCHTATLNSFRSILMDAQSQRLALQPLDQQSWLRNAAICNFITVLFSLHPYISSSPISSHSITPFHSQPPPPLFLFDSLGLLVPASLKVTLHLFLLARLGCLFFSILSFLIFSLFLCKMSH